MLFQLSDKLVFPDPALAEKDGLLAIGGDLSTARLKLAYSLGIFPWYSEGEPILWYSPHQRFVIFCDKVHISRSMQRFINSDKYTVTWNTAFEEVITTCAKIKRTGQRGTWITADMHKAYVELHRLGIAHSVEIWQDEVLVGGMYGVEVNRVFCGESMFSKRPNASKLALITVCQSGKYDLLDCQAYSKHLESMGGQFISREKFAACLKQA
jgi:leucyl/phenylalanyl-tRNA--protein transferase